MNVFISYAHEQRQIAEAISVSLSMRGHNVFFDRSKLKPAFEYDLAIQRAIEGCDLFIFLISPESVEKGTYTLSELGFAKNRWSNPSGKVLPVLVKPTSDETVDAYLQAVTILHPEGNIVAEVGARVDDLFKGESSGESGVLHKHRFAAAIGRPAIGVVIGAASAFVSGFLIVSAFDFILTDYFPSKQVGTLYTVPGIDDESVSSYTAICTVLGAIAGGVIAQLRNRSKSFVRQILFGVAATTAIAIPVGLLIRDKAATSWAESIFWSALVSLPLGVVAGMLLSVALLVKNWTSAAPSKSVPRKEDGR